MNRFLFLTAFLLVQDVVAQPFDGLDEAIERGDFGHIKALVVSQGGETLYENYFRGTQPGDLHTLNSVTKSVGSALVGIAHRQGRIATDQTLVPFFEDLYPMESVLYRNKRLVTVENVLQQRLGIEWDEWSTEYGTTENPVVQMINSGDWYQYVLTQPVDALPGGQYAYNSGGSNLMSRMIRVSTGTGPDEFAMRELFGPLGITDVHWELSDATGQGIGTTEWANPDRDVPLGFGLWLKPSDMLKIGELYRNGGIHGGRRILDASWIEASVVPYSNSSNTELFAGNPGSGYGYQWWVHTMTDDLGRSWPGYYASGWGRQYILVYPDLELVVSSVANDYAYDGPGIGSILRSHLMPQLAPALDRRFNGAWYNPDTDGQGMTLEVLDQGRRLIGFWYTYGENSERRWFTFDGTIEGNEAAVTIIETQGGRFLQSDPIERIPWGTGHFSVFDCDQIDLAIESAEVTAMIPLTRLTGSCSSSAD